MINTLLPNPGLFLGTFLPVVYSFCPQLQEAAWPGPEPRRMPGVLSLLGALGTVARGQALASSPFSFPLSSGFQSESAGADACLPEFSTLSSEPFVGAPPTFADPLDLRLTFLG